MRCGSVTRSFSSLNPIVELDIHRRKGLMASCYTWVRVSHYITCCCYEVERMGAKARGAEKQDGCGYINGRKGSESNQGFVGLSSAMLIKPS